MKSLGNLISTLSQYRQLGIENQIDYNRFYLYSLITHSTAIEGSTITELENQLLFDEGITAKGKPLIEQMMNLDLKAAYEMAIQWAKIHKDITVDLLKELSAKVMEYTGIEYSTALGDFSSAKGDLRLLNVSAGFGGSSYLSYNKVPTQLASFCEALNIARKNVDQQDIQALYDLSFDTHYQLVTIHPWADGNGRMSRLLMNYIQFEFGIVPVKVLKDDKEFYIKALNDTREKEDLSIFRKFMTEMHIKNMQKEVESYSKSLEKQPLNSMKLGEKVG